MHILENHMLENLNDVTSSPKTQKSTWPGLGSELERVMDIYIPPYNNTH